MDIEKLAAAIAPVIKHEVQRSVSAADIADGIAATVAAIFERRFSDLMLAWDRNAREAVDKAIGGMPTPPPGKDGRDFERPEFIYDGRRSFIVRALSGDEVVEHTFTLPLVIDAGFFKEGTEYTKGDGVTFAGSYWIAQSDTQTKPEIGNPDWRLAVKKGRDGKGRA